MLKILGIPDIEEGVEILHSFFQESHYSERQFSYDKVRALWEKASSDPSYLLLGYYKDNHLVGILVGLKTELLFSEEVVCSELVWYVYPEYRQGSAGFRLYKGFEYWSKNVVKASSINMAHLGDERVANVYTKLGFRKAEESYSKDI